MNTLVALVAGYLLGAKTRGRDLDRLGQSLKALCATDEFDDVVAATRAQVGSTLRDLAGMIDGGGTGAPRQGAADNGDLVSRVRELVGRS
jgi:hypothetical protein